MNKTLQRQPVWMSLSTHYSLHSQSRKSAGSELRLTFYLPSPLNSQGHGPWLTNRRSFPQRYDIYRLVSLLSATAEMAEHLVTNSRGGQPEAMTVECGTIDVTEIRLYCVVCNKAGHKAVRCSDAGLLLKKDFLKLPVEGIVSWCTQGKHAPTPPSPTHPLMLAMSNTAAAIHPATPLMLCFYSSFSLKIDNETTCKQTNPCSL